MNTRQNLEILASDRVAGDPTPGPANAAFSVERVTVEGYVIRPVRFGDWIILKAINSPMHQMNLGEKPEDVKWEYQDMVNLAYLFTRPAKEARAALEKGVDVFHRTAVEVIGDEVDDAVMTALCKAIQMEFRKYYQSAIGHDASSQSDDENRKIVTERNFTGAAQQTG